MSEIAETSFPRENAPLTVEEWSSVTYGLGTGTYDEGTGDYRITYDNASDTATIAPPSGTGYAHAAVAGYYHHLYKPVKLPIPPVSEKTSYYITITHDPVKAATEPAKLMVWKGNLDYTGGKKHLIMVRIDREPNQVLTAAKKQDYKPRIAPSLDVQDAAALPPAEGEIFGTQYFVNDERSVYRTSIVKGREEWARILGTRMIKPLDMPGWKLAEASPNQYGFASTPVPAGFKLDFSAMYQRDAFDYVVGENWSVLGTFIPENFRTTQYAETMFPVAYDTGHGIYTLIARVSFFDGTLSLISQNGNVTISRNGALHIPSISWVANKVYVTDW